MGSKQQQKKQQLVSKATGEPENTVTMWRFVTFEAVVYFLSYIACLVLTFFYPGNIPIYERGSGLLTQHRAKVLPEIHDAFDVFRRSGQGSAQDGVMAYQMSSDLVLILMLVFTMNACLLAFIRRVMEHLREEETKVKLAESGKNVDGDKNVGADAFGKLELACREMIKSLITNFAGFLCIVIALCVLLQPPNQIRGIGPTIMLLSLIASVCIFLAHGGYPAVVKVLSIYQAFIITGLVCLVADASVFSSGFKAIK